MQRERVSENVYWFQSAIYAQVTAGVVLGTDWAVVIDTLAMPEETLAMRSFVEEELKVPVRYVINTHYHADHTWGNFFFPGATVVSSALCRKLMIERGMPALEETRHSNPAFKKVKMVLPHLTFELGTMSLTVGKKRLTLLLTPGNSPDGISVLIEEDRVLFAGDAFMPIPYIVDGDYDQLRETMERIGQMGLENIVQGHGDIILRGEIEGTVEDNLRYLDEIYKAAKMATRRRNPSEALEKVDVQSCGKSRVYLEGLAEELHQRNMRFLYLKLKAEKEAAKS
ncbi:MAG: MBL fold metallo-hydrolase [Anaerolineaceae bacterium]|nr:MBL fold metallo-hydrolase [Anaerolineaceae bacterium]